MDDTELKLRREVCALQAKIRRLKQMIGVVIVFTAIVAAYPGGVLIAAGVAMLILFALLVSPVRHLIFPSIFRKRD